MSDAARLLVLVGATGCGKSELAVELAERLDGEIVGCDALQVYRGFDAATAKPPASLRARIPHHLIDCVDPRIDFTAADWVRRAERVVSEIHDRGRVPLIVGGTGLYLRGLLRGLIPAPARDPELRERLRAILARGGARRLHHLLSLADPRAAERIAPADAPRLIRALELARAEGPNWSERIRRDGRWSEKAERYPNLKIALDRRGERYTASLEQRVAGFFRAGLVDEVRALLRQGVPASANAFRAIGYGEVLDCLERDEEPAATREAIVRRTLRYAKRQRSWFRGEPGVRWLDVDEASGVLVERAIDLWHRGALGAAEPDPAPGPDGA